MKEELQQLIEKIERSEAVAESDRMNAEKRLVEIRKQLAGVKMTAQLLDEETPSLPNVNGTKQYANTALSMAVLHYVLHFVRPSGQTRAEIAAGLKLHGFDNRSDSLYSSVSVTLTRLAKRGDIRSIEGENGAGMKFAPPEFIQISEAKAA